MVQPAAAARPALAASFNDHNRLRRSTDIPLFYARREKDSVLPRILIDRIEDAAAIATWDEAQKIRELKLCFLDRAIIWWKSLQDDNIDLAVWEDVKKEFLDTFEPKYSAKTICTNFADLKQHPDESMNDYRCRVQVAYNRLINNKPTTMATVRLAGATVAQAKAKGINDIALFFKHQLFLAGIKDPICDKVLEAGKATFQESMKFYREIKAIQNDRKCSQKIAAVKASMQPNEADAVFWDKLADKEIDQIAAVRCQQPFRNTNTAETRAPAPARSNGPRNPNVMCRYCKKKGHWIPWAKLQSQWKIMLLPSWSYPEKTLSALSKMSLAAKPEN
jgi:Retrotransposon gag protein